MTARQLIRKAGLLPILVLCLALLLPALAQPAQAAELDEILRYDITVDVNPDATLHMVYHIDWKVLDSTSEGPLTWVEIGLPNQHCEDLTGLSPAVKSIRYSSSSGSYARIDLDRAYRAGEVAAIEFEFTQDYMYQVDLLIEGETVYRFTPGWFDDIRVDELSIRWNGIKALSRSPESTVDGRYLLWTTSLDKGEKFPVSVTYSNSAFAFDLSKEIQEGSEDDEVYAIIGGLVFLGIIGGVIAAIAKAFGGFARTANFGNGTRKKITRTKIVYYPVCQGCGGTRPEGASNCPYCGRSFIQSEEVIKEEDIPKSERALRKKTTDGLYQYASQPNTYMRVHVTHVPVPRSSTSSATRGARSSSCAHSSCACACACACAGGGRAGCSTKDFYNTGLKLRQLTARRSRDS